MTKSMLLIALFLPLIVFAQGDTSKCKDIVISTDKTTGNIYTSTEATIALKHLTTVLYIVPTIIRTENNDSLQFRMMTYDYTNHGYDTVKIDRMMLARGIIKFLFSDGTKYSIKNYQEHIHTNEHGSRSAWYECGVGGADLTRTLKIFSNKELKTITFSAHRTNRDFHMVGGGTQLMNTTMQCLSQHTRK